MQSLQYLSTTTLLDNIPINEQTSPAIDNFLIRYLSNHTDPIDYLINNNTLFHVFFRTQDPVTDNNNCGVLTLLKTFINLDKAITWIYKNGKDIVEEQEQRYQDAIVLTIVTMNDRLYDNDEHPEPEMISDKAYLTFAFSKKGWQMIKDEFTYVSMDRRVIYIPYWLMYIKDGVIHRYTSKNLHELHKSMDLENTYPENQRELLLYLKNPNKYMKTYLII